MQAFTLDQASGIPVKLQLKAHIKYQIVTALLRPGDQLPPLRDLAAGLGINLNTVVRAIGELEAEGYVYSHQGKGVFVADEFPGQGHGAAMRSLFAGVLGPTQQWGMAPEEMALALMAHAQLAKPPQAAPFRLLLVGGSRPQLRRLQGELEAALPVIVEPALAEEAAEKLRTGHFKVAAATLFHADDLKRQMPQGDVVTLASTPVIDRFRDLQQLTPGSTVAIAARDWLHAARVRRSLEACSLPSFSLVIAAGQTPAALAESLRSADYVLATPDCREIAREALGAKSQTTLLAEPVELLPEAVQTIRRLLGVPVTEARVHVRSAWV